MFPRVLSPTRFGGILAICVGAIPMAVAAGSGPSTTAVTSVCEPGITAPYSNPVAGLITPPEHTFYTRIRPSECPECPEGILRPTDLRLILYYSARCTHTVRISIVRSSGDPACPVPDPSVVLCPPTLHTLSPFFTGTSTFILPLPADCCLDREAFVAVTFVDRGNCVDMPGFWQSAACEFCVTYQERPGVTLKEFCPSGIGNLAVSTPSDCCPVTGTAPSTWGKIKTLYR